MAKLTIQTAQREMLLGLIDEGYDKIGWMEVSLLSAIRRVSAKEAAWRPRPGRHSIAEIVLHDAYYKYVTARRITGGKRGSFPFAGSDWFAVPRKLSDTQWKQYVTILTDAHQTLRKAIATAPWSKLNSNDKNIGVSLAHITGIAMHDAYHTGQIKTIRALYKQATKGRKSK
ncbi:MAG: DinB family protein [Planctomycetes bacterium]|nr:DinB family protein [Planctomycetota bacterium]